MIELFNNIRLFNLLVLLLISFCATLIYCPQQCLSLPLSSNSNQALLTSRSQSNAQQKQNAAIAPAVDDVRVSVTSTTNRNFKKGMSTSSSIINIATTSYPSFQPSLEPTMEPTLEPTSDPTLEPTMATTDTIPPNNQKKNSSSDVGMIIGIVLAVCVLILIAVSALYFYKKRKRSENEDISLNLLSGKASKNGKGLETWQV